MTTLLILVTLLQQNFDWALLREQEAGLADDDPAERAAARADLMKADKAALLEGMKDERVRDIAAIALGVQGEDKARSILLDLRRNKDVAVRARAFEALGGLKVDASTFLDAFADDPRVAFAAARGLSRSDPDRAHKRLSAILAERRGRIAPLAAIVGLLSLGREECWAQLPSFFSDADPKVASAAVIAAFYSPGNFSGALLRGPTMNASLDAKARLLAFSRWRKIEQLHVKDLAALLRDPAVRKQVFELIAPAAPSRKDVAIWLTLLKDDAVARQFGPAIEEWIVKATGIAAKRGNLKELEDATFQDRVDQAVALGIAHLKKAAKGDHWTDMSREIGCTALALYTHLRCGAKPTDPEVTPGLEWLLKQPIPQSTYEASLCALLFGEISVQQTGVKGGDDLSARCIKKLAEAAQYLIRAQSMEGSWGYTAGGSMDNSNTQFAVIGLRAAQNAGFNVPRDTWRRCAAHFRAVQDVSGGWACYGGPGRPYARMSAAGLMSLLIAESSASNQSIDTFLRKKNAQSAVIWLDKNWTLPDGDYYWLYSLERACMIAGLKKIGEHDWYREGAEQLLSAQSAEGVWTGGYGIVDHCFALLFLKRAYVPVGPAVVETGKGGSRPEEKPAPGK